MIPYMCGSSPRSTLPCSMLLERGEAPGAHMHVAYLLLFPNPLGHSVGIATTTVVLLDHPPGQSAMQQYNNRLPIPIANAIVP